MAYDLKSEEDVKQYIKNLGIEYRFGCYKEKKPEVCHLLGDYLEAINKDFEKALKVYKTNCDDSNFSKSCYKTACYYMAGKGGLKQSTDKGYEYFQKACHYNDPESCYRVGILSILGSKSLKRNHSFSEGVNYLIKSCDAKHANACHHLSAIYMDGDASAKISKDMRKAFDYAVKGCNLGNIYACVNVSIMYKRGDGVEQNAAESEKFKKKAVEMSEEINQQKQLQFQEGLAPA